MKEILEQLNAKNISTIREFAQEAGYNEVYVFKSPLAVDEDTLNFLVNVDQTCANKITLLSLGILYSQIGKIFNDRNIVIVQNDEVDELFKPDILANMIQLCVENLSKIQHLLNEENSNANISNYSLK